MLFKLFDCFKNMTTRWRNQFSYVNIGETLFFFLSEIARPSKKDNFLSEITDSKALIFGM